MFRRGLCARCLLRDAYLTLQGRPLPSLYRNASQLVDARPKAASERSPPCFTKLRRPIAEPHWERIPWVASISKLHTKARNPDVEPDGIHAGDSPKTTSALLGASSTAQDWAWLDSQEDLQAVFTVTEEANIRLREVSQYIAQNYERKRTRNSILKSPQKSDWQTDWRPSFDMLRMEFVVGKYVENAQAPSAQRKDHQTRWDREISPFNVPEPRIHSKRAFHTYVQRILSLQAPQPLQRLLYPQKPEQQASTPNDHVSHVSTKIESIFREEAFRPFLTTQAFEDALRFMIRHNRLSTARQLLNMMIENKVTIRTSTFNLFFGSAAFHSDLRFFTYILKLKQSLAIPSDGHTWGAYLKTLLSTRAKLTVFWEMAKIGLFKDPIALQKCVTEIISAELQHQTETGEPLLPVLERFDASFGQDWMSVAAGNTICRFLGASGLIEQVPRVLTFMESRGCKPNSETFSILIHQSSLTGKNLQVLDVVKLFQSKYGLLPRAQDFDYLFKAAWETRSFNSCRILWRLACGFGFGTRNMQDLLYRSLLRNTPQNPSTAEERWMKEAGKVITFSRPKHPQMKTFLGDAGNDTYATGSARIEQRELAASILRRDRLIRLRGSFEGDWIPIYEAAVRRDEKWTEKDVLSTKPLRWKLLNVACLGKSKSAQRVKLTGNIFKRVYL